MSSALRTGLGIGLAGLIGTAMLKLTSCSWFHESNLLTPEQLERKLLDRPVITEAERQQRKKYAVVLNGDASKLHQGNVTEAYESLKHLGFYEENIFLLTSDYGREDDGKAITAKATEANLRRVFDYLDDAVDNNDLVLLYTTGHGRKQNNQSTVLLADAELFASDLRDMVGSAKAGEYVIVADQCYSGGIAKSLSELEGRVVSFSSTDSDHITYCESFARPFWQSFRNGQADVNNDGTTTLDEAFDYASKNHKEKIGQFPNSGLTANTQEYRTPESPNQL